MKLKIMGGSCSTFGESRGMYISLVRKPEEKERIGRVRLRYEDNIKMDLQEGNLGYGID
jgi:predicted acetyltransferase